MEIECATKRTCTGMLPYAIKVLTSTEGGHLLSGIPEVTFGTTGVGNLVLPGVLPGA